MPDGYRYVYVNGVFYGSSVGSGVVNGARMEYFYEYACSGNETVDVHGVGAGHMCAAALTCRPQGTAIRTWTFARPVGDTTAPQRIPGSRCLGAPKTVTLADVQAAYTRYLKDAHLPKPAIITAPPTGGLVNLPQIFATADNPPLNLTVTVPLPASLTAEPHYGWNFGDGATGPDTPGVPYQPGILPVEHPDYYLTHTYLTNATITTTLTVTWHATFTVTGIAGTFPIPDITFTTTHTMPIRQARSELVANP